ATLRGVEGDDGAEAAEEGCGLTASLRLRRGEIEVGECGDPIGELVGTATEQRVALAWQRQPAAIVDAVGSGIARLAVEGSAGGKAGTGDRLRRHREQA